MFEHWVERFFRPFVVAGMMACVVISMVELFRIIAPAWDGRYYVALAFLASLEGIYSERLIKSQGLQGKKWLEFRLIEVVVILLAWRVVSYLPVGLKYLLADMALWAGETSIFFSVDFLAGGFTLLILWQLALFIAQDLHLIGEEVRQSGPAPERGSVAHYLWLTRTRLPIDRRAALGRIVGNFFWGGCIIMVFSGLTRMGLSDLFKLDRPPMNEVVLNVLIYFLLGLLLISQAYFSIRRVEWEIEGTECPPTLASRWAFLSLGFIGLMTVLAFFLPTGYTLGLPQFLFMLVSWGWYILLYVLFLLFVPLWLFLTLLFSLLPPGMRFDRSELPWKMQPPTMPQTPGTSPFWEALKMVVFWAIFMAVASYSIYIFLRDRRGWLLELRPLRFLRRLIGALQGLWRKARRSAGEIKVSFGRLKDVRIRPGKVWRPWHFIFLSSKEPREQVRYFYLSLLKRAAEIGYPRLQHHTPYEYAAWLSARWPEIAPGWQSLTQAFVEACYSRREITQAEAETVKALWQNMQAMFPASRLDFFREVR
ncbi:MAG: DUF4129 domain-containing protein [Anaerolineae bacterium]